jgi:3-deoxy-D-arabino-heptulosonate 7-phosphate (DAHP) synthase
VIFAEVERERERMLVDFYHDNTTSMRSRGKEQIRRDIVRQLEKGSKKGGRGRKAGMVG